MANARYLLIGLLAIAGIAAIFHPPAATPIVSVNPPTRSSPLQRRVRSSKVLVVYVAGAVKRPGIYRVPDGTRAVDAISRAGGLRDDADPAGVDLAEVLFDGEEVAAPVLGARRTSKLGIRKPARVKKVAKSKAGADLRLDVNAAGVDELAQLPGIGDEMARRLVRYRDVNGPFASLDELADVAGMTQHRIDLVTPLLFVLRQASDSP